MNATSHGPEPRDERLDVARALYAALMAARPYVLAHSGTLANPAGDSQYATASQVLERVDGALADAGEYLSGVAS